MDQERRNAICRACQLVVGIFGIVVSVLGLYGVLQFSSVVRSNPNFSGEAIREMSSRLEKECAEGRITVIEAMAPLETLLQKRLKDVKDFPRILAALFACLAGVSVVMLTGTMVQINSAKGKHKKAESESKMKEQPDYNGPV